MSLIEQASDFQRQPPDAQARGAAGNSGSTGAGKGFRPFGEDGLTFFDVLDVLNPMQHLPVVSTIYRELSGDKIDPVARLAGGAAYGGLIGLGSSLANVVLEAITGRDFGEHIFRLVEDRFEHEQPAAPWTAEKGVRIASADAGTGAIRSELPPDSLRARSVDVLQWARLDKGFKPAVEASGGLLATTGKDDGEARPTVREADLLSTTYWKARRYRSSAALGDKIRSQVLDMES
jgi:hypothetical protein